MVKVEFHFFVNFKMNKNEDILFKQFLLFRFGQIS